MVDLEVKYDEEKVRELLEEKKSKDPNPPQPRGGEINGLRFALNHLNDVDELFERYRVAQEKMSTWYTLDRTIGLIPFLGIYVTYRAWYWEGYQMMLARVLGVYRHRDARGDDTVVKIIENETERVIYEEQE